MRVCVRMRARLPFSLAPRRYPAFLAVIARHTQGVVEKKTRVAARSAIIPLYIII